VPKRSEVNFTPTSMELGSAPSAAVGASELPKMEHGHATLTVVPADGDSRLPLSSTARDLSTAEELPWADQVYDQLVVPFAGCQVVPPSVETSTPATTPPPESLAVPWMVTVEASARLAPGAGEVMFDVGGVVSNDGDALTRPEMRANGWAPMSAKRFTVACCMVRSVPAPVHVLSRPRAHWT